MAGSLVLPKTNDAINKIVKTAFDGNALFDNIAYNLDVIFNMPVANDIVHHKVAHWLPAPFADDIQAYQSQRNTKPIRPIVDAQTKTYESIVECFEDGYKYFMGLENDFKTAIKVADSEGDIASRIFLENKMIDILPFIKQMQIWVGKAQICADSFNLDNFDANFESFTII
jgi:hypothetical protein